MIKGFKHKGLKKLYETGSRHGVNPEHVKRLRIILARLDASLTPQDMNLPGLGLHLLKGKYDGFGRYPFPATGGLFSDLMETTF